MNLTITNVPFLLDSVSSPSEVSLHGSEELQGYECDSPSVTDRVSSQFEDKTNNWFLPFRLVQMKQV